MVLAEISKCIDRFDYDARLGKFRNWLLVVARSKLSKLANKAARLKGSGDTKVLELLKLTITKSASTLTKG